MLNKTLIIQGGGFRTAFSTGVLDAFLVKGYNPFQSYVAVSGGAIALSYYLSGQYKRCIEAMRFLAVDKNFMSWNRFVSSKGIMDIDYFRDVADRHINFELDRALNAVDNKELAFVLTNRMTGDAHYYSPNEKTWVDSVIATCTLPFVTKGKHILHGEEFFDGGWSDPIPVKWAYDRGARDIVVVRTTPALMQSNQSWPDYFASFVYRSNEGLKKCFEENHKKFNEAVHFMANPPSDLNLIQIAPEDVLKTGTYSNNIYLIDQDYRYGLDKGLEFLKHFTI